MDQPQDPEAQAAVLGWRAFVALLLGHIELYGHNNPAQAAKFYQQVLMSQPQETLAELGSKGWNAVFSAARSPASRSRIQSKNQLQLMRRQGNHPNRQQLNSHCRRCCGIRF